MNIALPLLIVITALASIALLKKKRAVAGLMTGAISGFLITAFNLLKLARGEPVEFTDKLAMIIGGLCGVLLVMAAALKVWLGKRNNKREPKQAAEIDFPSSKPTR